MFERRPEFVSKAGVGHNYQTNHLKLDGDAGDDSKMPGPPLTARQAKEWASQKTIGLVPGRVAVFQCFQPQAGMPSTPNYLATRGLIPTRTWQSCYCLPTIWDFVPTLPDRIQRRASRLRVSISHQYQAAASE